MPPPSQGLEPVPSPLDIAVGWFPQAPSGGSMVAVTTWIILNPAAGSGRARAAGTRLAHHLPGAKLLTTAGPGDAERLAREARHHGIQTVVAVGGDGTIHECASGLVLEEDGSEARSGTRLAVAPAGTGGDFRRTFDWVDSVDQAHARISDPNPLPVDVGKITFADQGKTTTSTFLNVLSFGLGGLADQIVDRGPKWLGGRAAYFLGTLRANLIHKPLPIELVLDGQTVEIAPFSNVAVCNGRYLGGGMNMAPDADPSDGLFDVVTMELSKLETLTLAADIYRGTHLNRQRVKHYRCKTLEARTTRSGESLIDVDGEQLGALPLRVDVLKGALELLT